MKTERPFLERAAGIEPVPSAWEAEILPLNYARGEYSYIIHPNSLFVKGFRTFFLLTRGLCDYFAGFWKHYSHKIKKRRVSYVTVKRGDIYYADLSPVVGSEQGGLRPVLIVQNDVGNKYSPTVIAAAITSQIGKTKLPTHIDVIADRFGLSKDSVILLEQIRTIDKQRLKEKMGHLDDSVMQRVNDAIGVSFGLTRHT